LPLPLPELHFLVSGIKDLDPAAFLDIGRACANDINRLVDKHAKGLDAFEAVLDFGCGCGRVMRHLHGLKNVKLHGTDYNPRLVDWCRTNLPFATFGLNQLQPPLAYEDSTFDLAWAFSVFTHLPEA